MIVDLSQAAVNRTAMYMISHDTYACLKDRRTGCQFFGEVFTEIPSADRLRQMQQRAFDRLGDPDRLAAEANVRPRRRGGQPVLYLDPLYVLYGGLQAEDHVMILDLSTVTHPHWHNPNVARAYRAAFDLIARRRPNILAISENTADTLYANYGIPRERIAVVPLYVPDHFTAHAAVTPIHTPFPYVLFVGSVEARKNLIGAIEIFALSELSRKGYRLLVVGGAGHGNAEIQAAAARARSVIFCGYLSNEELHGLYAAATAFLYPSYLEGFGVPLLEALHFGVPAVASTTGACPEVGGGLMCHFDPDDHAGFANELRRLVALSPEERAAYRAKATAWVAERYALGHYERVLKASLDAVRPRESVPGQDAARDSVA